MQFHERLKKYRKEKKLTQEELAEHLHVSRSAIAKWENGLGLPSNDSLEEIATFFETTREDLLADRETEMVIVEKNSALSRQKKWLITLVALVVALLVVSSVFLGIFLTSSKEPTTVGEDAEILGIEACFLAESETLKGDEPLQVYHLKAGETYALYVRLRHRGSKDVTLEKSAVKLCFDARFFLFDEGEYWEEPDRDATPSEAYPFYFTCLDAAAYTEILVIAGGYWCRVAAIIEA